MHETDETDLDDQRVVGGFGSPVADRVYELLAPVVATVDAEVVDVHWSGGTLRVVADRVHPEPEAGSEPSADDQGDGDGDGKGDGEGEGDGKGDGDDRITMETLAQINRLISPILDQHDPVPGRYTLEVSSPGVERPLRRPEHYARAVGEMVVVKSVPGCEPRRVRGLLRSVADDRLEIEVDEIDGVELAETTSHSVALADIDTARTHFDWGPAPKPGKGGKRGKGQGKGKAGTRSGGSAKAKQPNKKKHTQQKRNEDGPR